MIGPLKQLAAHPDGSVSAAASQAIAILSGSEPASSEAEVISSCVQL